MNNKFFLRQGAYWHQRFGRDFNTAKVQSSWLVGWAMALHYRITPNIYIEMAVPAFKYSQVKYSSLNSPILPEARNQKERSWAIFSCALVRFMYKI